MAKSLNVAIKLLEKSIELGKEDSRYYMDFFKVHSLMYIGQCYKMYKYNSMLFEENVIATNNGPIIEGIDLIPGACGFSEIYNIDELKTKYCKMFSSILDKENKDIYAHKFLELPLPYLSDETINFVLEHYGMMSTDELVILTKNTYAYQVYKGNYDKELVLHPKDIKVTGKEIIDNKDKFIVQNSCERLCSLGQCPKMRKKIKE